MWTVDACVEGVHFRREWASLRDIGWRSFMAAASDLAAMGASPRGALSALVLPETFTDAELDELRRVANRRSVRDRNVGHRRQPFERRRAVDHHEHAGRSCPASSSQWRQAGDTVAVAGKLGLAAAGLEALRRGVSAAGVAAAIDAWKRPRALIADGLAGGAKATAGIDLSDGLALDVSRVATESGVSIILDAARILVAGGPELAEAAKALSLEPLDLALYGGEDYALVMTFAPATWFRRSYPSANASLAPAFS